MRRLRSPLPRLDARLLLVLLCAGASGASGAGPSKAGDARPNVLLVTVDTLRPDALGWVSPGRSTPAIDRLAAEGFRTPAAVTPVPLTLPAHTSILSGWLPDRHGVHDNGQLVPPGVPLLAEILSRSGYRTAAMVSGFPLQAMFGLDRGFDTYDDHLPSGVAGFVERSAAETTDAALAWIGSVEGPWFLWVHYYDPHDPYEPPRAFWRPGKRGPYDGEVAYVDRSFARLREGIAARFQRPWLTVLTADHGEALGEHEEETHGFFVYDSTVLVPLVVHFPGRIAPLSSSAPIRLVDLPPTILELVGVEPKAAGDGESVVDLLQGGAERRLPALVETRLPWTYFGWSPLRALRVDGWKMIEAPRPELYDLRSDAAESRNALEEQRPLARRLIEEMRRLTPAEAAAATRIDDPETTERLRSLGYLGGDRAASEPHGPLDDPKDRIGLRRALLAADSLAGAGRSREAVEAFDAILKEHPGNPYALLRSGLAMLRAGNLAPAAERLAQAVAADPARAEARFALGDALQRSGRYREAVPQWMELARLQPRRAEAWKYLAAAFAALGEHGRAASAAERAAGVSGEPGPLWLEAARQHARAGDDAASRSALARALSADAALRAVAAADPLLAPRLP